MAEFADAKSGAYCTCTRERCSDECRTYRHFRPKPITKADRIRAMSDEELAKEFADYISCHNCPIPYCKVRFTMNRLGCQSNWIDWLKQEADHE